MRKIFGVLVCLLLAAEVSAQQTVKSSDVGAFNSIHISGKLEVQLIKAEANSIEIVLFDCDITRLKWGVTNSMLSISLRNAMNGSGYGEVKIYYKNIDALNVSRGEVTTNEPITSDLFDLKAGNGAKITASFQCLDMNIDVTGNSVALLTGYSKYLKLRSAEKSKLEARALECVSAVATAVTGGEIYVCAQERLEADAKTGSTIFYKGEPTIIRAPTSKFMGLGASVHNIGK